MALKAKKGLKGSIDDVLGDLLGDDILLEKPVETASHAKDTSSSPQWLSSKAKIMLCNYAWLGTNHVAQSELASNLEQSFCLGLPNSATTVYSAWL